MRVLRRPEIREERGRRQAGQALVQFVLTFPLFLILLMALIEFAFAFNALLSLNYATRNGALIAAEAGSSPGGDCVILENVDASISDPATEKNISQVLIFWTDTNGKPLDTTGTVWYAGDSNPMAANTYARASSPQTCPDGNDYPDISYTQVSVNYPADQRCNDVLGSLALCPTGHATLDDIGVQITYSQSWKTPMHTFIGLMGNGWTLVQANEMRMEPVL
jgi:Flp pilus assembly protein TadG